MYNSYIKLLSFPIMGVWLYFEAVVYYLIPHSIECVKGVCSNSNSPIFQLCMILHMVHGRWCLNRCRFYRYRWYRWSTVSTAHWRLLAEQRTHIHVALVVQWHSCCILRDQVITYRIFTITLSWLHTFIPLHSEEAFVLIYILQVHCVIDDRIWSITVRSVQDWYWYTLLS